MKKNNLELYLDYYLGLDAPGFAVLVTGEWGSGKTFQVMNAIPDELQCHVSLFGISDSQEVYNTVFAKMFPGKNFAKKLLDMTKDISGEMDGITLGAGSLVGNILSPLIKLTVDRNKVIIFDDLERCSMSNKEIFGVINQYIEHHQCKVIILAHDKETHDDFIKTKEKIIGHTIQIDPQIEDAAIAFFSEKFKLNNFKSIKPIIIDAFIKTNCKSLRILKYVINDCNRLLECLEPIHLKNTEAMKALFNFFCIVNIEHKMGNITTTDIAGIPKDYIQYAILLQDNEVNAPEPDESKRKRVAFYSKYNDMDLRSDILDHELAAKIIQTGDYPREEIVKSLGVSKFFIQQFDNPPWLTIINFDSQDSTVVKSAIDEMFEKLKQFTITDIGEMMHSFCLSYMLSEKGEIKYSFDELFQNQINYIDNLLEKELLPPEPLNFDPFSDDVYERSYSHMYWLDDSYNEYINKIIIHIKKCRKTAKIKKYHIYANEIIEALDTNIDSFKKLLIGTSSEVGLYSSIDIMNYIDPDDFINHWLNLPVELWSKVGSILNARYRGAAHNNLANEKQWLQKVSDNLLTKAGLHNGLDQYRIERLVPHSALKSF
ncbi:KAP family NTPase [Salmonella enterica]|nr:KAP family NTPase [Salmonella enterica]